MKYFATLACLAATAFAQRISIGVPASMSTITPGSNITVQVERANSLTGVTEVAIAIGLWPCGGVKGSSTCAQTDVSQVLGNVVYTGPYSPQPQSNGQPPQQNFTVAVPSSFKSGQVSLGVAHFSLVGAGATPFYEFANVTVIVP